MTSLIQTIPEIFSSASLSIQQTEAEAGPAKIGEKNSSERLPTSSITEQSPNIYITSAYFRDATSKRAKVVIPVVIQFQNEYERTKLLKSGAVEPKPIEYDGGNEDFAEDVDPEEEKDMWDAELDLIGETPYDDDLEQNGKNEIRFECTCIEEGGDLNYKTSMGERDLANNRRTIIEGVKVLSTSLVDVQKQAGIRFDVEIAVRSMSNSTTNTKDIKRGENTSMSASSDANESALSNKLEVDLHKRAEADMAKAQIELRATLITTIDQEEKAHSYLPSPRHSSSAVQKIDNPDIQLGLQALDMGTSAVSPYETDGTFPTSSYFSQELVYSLPPKTEKAPLLKLDILPALLVSVREVSAAASNTGITLVSLAIYHSNVHNENVTITNIALHPGHSRLFYDSLETVTPFGNGNSMVGGEHAVIDMTKNVRWGYASGTAPTLPFMLKPQDAFATVIQINANEVMMERTFVSPICVRAAVGTNHCSAKVNVNSSDTFRNKKGKNTSVVRVSSDARWTTSPVAVGSTDAFRVSLSIRETVCNVGAQVVVGLKVTNLSSNPRDLMLIMAKDSDTDDGQSRGAKDTLNGMTFAGGNTRSGASALGMSGASANAGSQQTNSQLTIPQNTVNNAVVYEVSGYTFGCWGLSGDDDGTMRYTRDHDLLAVDAALLLGEVKGQLAIESELRFVPLREGTLSVPNLKLYDKMEAKWYDCYHTLKIISVAKQ